MKNIFRNKINTYKYGIIFYDPETYKEIRLYFYSTSHYFACLETSKLEIPGYIKCEPQYIEDIPYSDYHTNLFDYFRIEGD